MNTITTLSTIEIDENIQLLFLALWLFLARKQSLVYNNEDKGGIVQNDYI